MEDAGSQLAEMLVLLLGTLTTIIVLVLGKLGTWFKSLPTMARGLIVGVIAIPVALLGGQMGVELPADPTTWDGNTVNAILTWASSMGIHAAGKALKKTIAPD